MRDFGNEGRLSSPAIRRFLVLSLMLAVAFFSGCSTSSSRGGSSFSGKLPKYYTVREGDTLNTIAARFHIPPSRIIAANNLTNPNRLFAGQRIALAGSSPEVVPVSLRNGQTRYSNGKLVWPVDGGYVASSFGPRFASFHDGIDIAAPEGVSVFAAHDGVVIYGGSDISGYGRLIILRHKTGLTSVYAHNSKILVDEFARVRRGQKIAEVGQTGQASGPHLHFEVRVKNSQGKYVAVDPLPLFSKENEKPRWRVNERLSPILARLIPFR